MRTLSIDFSRSIRPWDGFGINYVQNVQSRDVNQPQDYGGFDLLTDEKKKQIVDLVFGEDGLRTNLIKMFLDPFHQDEPGPGYDYSNSKIEPDIYNRTRSADSMISFVRAGVELLCDQKIPVEVMTTLYGPPGWMTKQKFVRGRDLDPAMKTEIAKYMAAWVLHLREHEKIPADIISLHNEGEDWMRWPDDGSTAGAVHHDHNMYWPPELVAEMIPVVKRVCCENGMPDVRVSAGEYTGWARFEQWGYADAVAASEEAIRDLGIITSHSFFNPHEGRWFSDCRSNGIDDLRKKDKSLRAWATSVSWYNMDSYFVWSMVQGIRAAKLNGVIPWAAFQVGSRWIGGDPNPGCAFKISGEGKFEVQPGYYFYKQLTRAGQAGMDVVVSSVNDSQVTPLAFAGNGTGNPDSFVLINRHDTEVAMDVVLDAPATSQWRRVVTTDAGKKYEPDDEWTAGTRLTLEPESVTTFFRI